MWKLAEKTLTSRLLLGTAQYPSLSIMQQAICAAETNVITVALRRQSPQQNGGKYFWDAIKAQKCHLLPNTAGCRNAREAIAAAQNNELPPQAVKLGMLGDIGIIEKLRRFLQNFSGKVVLDPVLYAGSGKNLFNLPADSYISTLKRLFPYVDLLTPNKNEAEIILGTTLTSRQDIETAAQALLSMGVKSVLMKGGHFFNPSFSQDFWTNGAEAFWLSSPRVAARRWHGAGCVLAAAITACLALGYSMKDAVVLGKMYVNQGMRLACSTGCGHR